MLDVGHLVHRSPAQLAHTLGDSVYVMDVCRPVDHRGLLIQLAVILSGPSVHVLPFAFAWPEKPNSSNWMRVRCETAI